MPGVNREAGMDQNCIQLIIVVHFGIRTVLANIKFRRKANFTAILVAHHVEALQGNR